MLLIPGMRSWLITGSPVRAFRQLSTALFPFRKINRRAASAKGLGSGLSFRQTAVAILMSFAIAAIILAGFAPLTLFVWFNAPPLESKGAILGHSVMLLTHVFVIALAGVIANRRLLGLLRKMSGSDKVARAVLFSWLAGNLFLGAQIAWNLRPFIGSPRLAIEFLRSDPLRGNFYEAVWRALRHLFF